jgi:chaperonin GroEL (HSP60 family)
MLDEMERALHDSLCVIKRTLESGTVVAGGGAVETALSIYLENFATTLVSPLRVLARCVVTKIISCFLFFFC